MVKKILLIAAGLLVCLVIVIAMQPDEYRVTRTATIDAPADQVFALVNDFHHWDAWSPWAKLDPAMKTTYDGAASGVGAVYSWAGNSQAGEGRMTITESQPGKRVAIRLEFLKPFASTAHTGFVFTDQGAGSNVVWTMNGENNFLSKAFSLFMGGMDKMIGPDFEKGLSQLKTAAEARKS